MVNRAILYFLSRRAIAFLVFAAVGIYGAYSWSQLSVEAYPDIADVTSQVITQVPGLAAEEVERQITVPLEREINGTPGLSVMRSKSVFALSLITVVFKDGSESSIGHGSGCSSASRRSRCRTARNRGSIR